jgi:hypothetical protein
MYIIKEFVEFQESKFKEIFDILRKNGYIIEDQNIINDELTISAKRLRDQEYQTVPMELSDELLNLDIVKFVLSDFSINKKDQEYSTAVFKLLLTPGISDKRSNNYIGKGLKYVEKYNINSWDELIEDLAWVIRDLNKYVKVTGDKSLYSYKEFFIKYLYNNNYAKAYKHKYGEHDLVLFITKFYDDEKGDYISYHSLPHKVRRRIGINMNELPIKEQTPIKKSYTESDLKNPEKIKEALEFILNLNNGQFIRPIKNLFGEPLKRYYY